MNTTYIKSEKSLIRSLTTILSTSITTVFTTFTASPMNESSISRFTQHETTEQTSFISLIASKITDSSAVLSTANEANTSNMSNITGQTSVNSQKFHLSKTSYMTSIKYIKVSTQSTTAVITSKSPNTTSIFYTNHGLNISKDKAITISITSSLNVPKKSSKGVELKEFTISNGTTVNYDTSTGILTTIILTKTNSVSRGSILLTATIQTGKNMSAITSMTLVKTARESSSISSLKAFTNVDKTIVNYKSISEITTKISFKSSASLSLLSTTTISQTETMLTQISEFNVSNSGAIYSKEAVSNKTKKSKLKSAETSTNTVITQTLLTIAKEKHSTTVSSYSDIFKDIHRTHSTSTDFNLKTLELGTSTNHIMTKTKPYLINTTAFHNILKNTKSSELTETSINRKDETKSTLTQISTHTTKIGSILTKKLYFTSNPLVTNTTQIASFVTSKRRTYSTILITASNNQDIAITQAYTSASTSRISPLISTVSIKAGVIKTTFTSSHDYTTTTLEYNFATDSLYDLNRETTSISKTSKFTMTKGTTDSFIQSVTQSLPAATDLSRVSSSTSTFIFSEMPIMTSTISSLYYWTAASTKLVYKDTTKTNDKSSTVSAISVLSAKLHTASDMKAVVTKEDDLAPPQTSSSLANTKTITFIPSSAIKALSTTKLISIRSTSKQASMLSTIIALKSSETSNFSKNSFVHTSSALMLTSSRPSNTLTNWVSTKMINETSTLFTAITSSYRNSTITTKLTSSLHISTAILKQAKRTEAKVRSSFAIIQLSSTVFSDKLKVESTQLPTQTNTTAVSTKTQLTSINKQTKSRNEITSMLSRRKTANNSKPMKITDLNEYQLQTIINSSAMPNIKSTTARNEISTAKLNAIESLKSRSHQHSITENILEKIRTSTLLGSNATMHTSNLQSTTTVYSDKSFTTSTSKQNMTYRESNGSKFTNTVSQTYRISSTSSASMSNSTKDNLKLTTIRAAETKPVSTKMDSTFNTSTNITETSTSSGTAHVHVDTTEMNLFELPDADQTTSSSKHDMKTVSIYGLVLNLSSSARAKTSSILPYSTASSLTTTTEIKTSTNTNLIVQTTSILRHFSTDDLRTTTEINTSKYITTSGVSSSNTDSSPYLKISTSDIFNAPTFAKIIKTTRNTTKQIPKIASTSMIVSADQGSMKSNISLSLSSDITKTRSQYENGATNLANLTDSPSIRNDNLKHTTLTMPVSTTYLIPKTSSKLLLLSSNKTANTSSTLQTTNISTWISKLNYTSYASERQETTLATALFEINDSAKVDTTSSSFNEKVITATTLTTTINIDKFTSLTPNALNATLTSIKIMLKNMTIATQQITTIRTFAFTTTYIETTTFKHASTKSLNFSSASSLTSTKIAPKSTVKNFKKSAMKQSSTLHNYELSKKYSTESTTLTDKSSTRTEIYATKFTNTLDMSTLNDREATFKPTTAMQTDSSTKMTEFQNHTEIMSKAHTTNRPNIRVAVSTSTLPDLTDSLSSKHSTKMNEPTTLTQKGVTNTENRKTSSKQESTNSKKATATNEFNQLTTPKSEMKENVTEARPKNDANMTSSTKTKMPTPTSPTIVTNYSIGNFNQSSDFENYILIFSESPNYTDPWFNRKQPHVIMFANP